MLKQAGLLFRTLVNLKFTQIYHQVYYRIRSKQLIKSYSLRDQEVTFHKLKFVLTLPYDHWLTEEYTFTFLGRKKKFSGNIDWGFSAYGKLWNYNLQYFNFLNQADLSFTTKEKLLKDITEAIDTNHLKLEPYPVSLRAMNTIRYYSTTAGEPNDKVIKSCYAQIAFLNKNLEYHLLGNHLLENGFALLMAGASFRNQDWETRAERLLRVELDEQILKDGAHFELSPMYHQIILFRMLELIEWYSNYDDGNPEFLTFIKEKAKLMCSWLSQMTFRNGDIPHFNDSAPDIAFSSAKLKEFANNLGINEIHVPLHESGYRSFSMAQYQCIVDVGNLGPKYQSGHSHADCLSFVLYINDDPVIVDIGTSTYEIGKRRNLERSTSAHNTVTIQDKNQSEVWGGFRVGRYAEAKVLQENLNSLEGEHNGYIKYFKTNHRRKFEFGNQEIQIFDRIGESSGTSHFHFHPEMVVEIINKNAVLLKGVAEITFDQTISLRISTYEFADGFNSFKKALKLEVDFKEAIHTTIKVLSL